MALRMTAYAETVGQLPFHGEDRVRSHMARPRLSVSRAWTPTAPGPPHFASVGPHVGPHTRKERVAHDPLKDAARRRRPQ